MRISDWSSDVCSSDLYRVGMDHVQLAAETAELVRMALVLVGREASVESVTYRDLYLRELGIDPMTASDETLRAALGDVVIDPQSLVRDDCPDTLMTHRDLTSAGWEKSGTGSFN